MLDGYDEREEMIPMRKLFSRLFHRHDWMVAEEREWEPLSVWPYDWEVDGE